MSLLDYKLNLVYDGLLLVKPHLNLFYVIKFSLYILSIKFYSIYFVITLFLFISYTYFITKEFKRKINTYLLYEYKFYLFCFILSSFLPIIKMLEGKVGKGRVKEDRPLLVIIRKDHIWKSLNHTFMFVLPKVIVSTKI